MDLICFSHLRWNFVYQRPQHLLSRFAKLKRVFYIEEPVFINENSQLNISCPRDNLWVVVPQLQNNLSEQEATLIQQTLLTDFLKKGFASSSGNSSLSACHFSVNDTY